jgi:uncharacterized protein (DUF305 family)
MLERLAASPRWVRLLVGVVTAAFALTIGYAGGVLSTRLSTPDDGSAEAGFARDMSAHHAQAVEMALIAYPKATNPEVRTMAYDIATSQEYQIGVMQTWLSTWRLSPTSSRPAMAWMPAGSKELSPDGLMPGMATTAELAQLRAATGKDVDIQFCQLMLRHHLGGIHMIDGLLEMSGNDEVRAAAQGMRNAQSNDVAIMQRMLGELGAQPK